MKSPGGAGLRAAVAASFAALAVPCAPEAAAQGRTYLQPSVSFAALADSNVFSSPSAPESDRVRRTTPALRAGARSVRWQLVGGYTFDAEQFARHPVLDDVLARQMADATLRYGGRATTVSTTASYLTTHSPQELNTETGLIVARGPATRSTVGPSLRRQIGSRTAAWVDLEFEHSAYKELTSASLGAPYITTRDVTTGLDRRVSPSTLVLVQYRDRSFAFGGSPAAFDNGRGTSRAVLAGWTHDSSRLTQTTVVAGPRLSDGAVRLELAFDVRHRWRAATVAVNAARTEHVALGQVGAIEVQQVSATVTAQPARRLELRVGPGLRRDAAHTSGLRVTASALDATATAAIARWMSIEGAYHGAWDRGDVPSIGPLQFAHRVVSMRVIVGALTPPKAFAPRPTER